MDVDLDLEVDLAAKSIIKVTARPLIGPPERLPPFQLKSGRDNPSYASVAKHPFTPGLWQVDGAELSWWIHSALIGHLIPEHCSRKIMPENLPVTAPATSKLVGPILAEAEAMAKASPAEGVTISILGQVKDRTFKHLPTQCPADKQLEVPGADSDTAISNDCQVEGTTGVIDIIDDESAQPANIPGRRIALQGALNL